MRLSSRAEARSLPNGFSTITRAQLPLQVSFKPTAFKCFRIGLIEDRLRKCLPHFITHRLARKFPSSFFELSPELLITFLSSCKPDDFHRGRQVAIGGQVVKGRNEFAMREIARGAENHNGARLGHGARRQTFAQRIRLWLINGSVHGRPRKLRRFLASR